MASGDTKTQQYLDIAANGTRADLPSDNCCNTRTQSLIVGVAERIMDVEDEVEELKNNPDVADIVATYADLQAYDTSKLTDKDIIRVLTDETHDDASTYYRWSTSSQTFTYIGTSKQYDDFVGTDGTAAGSNGLVPAPATTDAGKFLNADGDWEDIAGVTTLYIQNGALTNLPANLYKDKNLTTISDIAYVKAAIDNGNTIVVREVEPVGTEYIYYGAFPMSGFYYENDYGDVYLGFTITDTNKTIYMCSAGMVETQSSLNMPLYGTTGTNINGPMTQHATTGMVYADPASRKKIKMGASATIVSGDSNVATSIGNRAKATGTNSIAISGNKDYDATASGSTSVMIGRGTASGVGSIAIGMATATGMNSVCISGNNTSATNSYTVAINGTAGGLSSVAIGSESSATAQGAVAIGANSSATTTGVVSIGSTNVNYGYSSSNYRLLSGVYDPQSAHDAATKGYVDGLVGNIESALNIINNGGN